MFFILSTILALSAGAMLMLSFAPIGFSLFAFISLILLLQILHKQQLTRQSLWLGYCYGIGFFSSSISWIYVSIHAFSQSVFLGITLTIVFILFLSLFFLVFGFFYIKLKNSYFVYRILLLPVTWLILELLRTHLFTGFPWVLLGYSQTHTFLSSFAPIGSVFLVGFVVCFIVICLSEIINHIFQLRIVISLISTIIICLLIAVSLQQIKWTHSDGIEKSVSILQGKFIQNQKWDPSMLQTIINYYYTTTKDNLADLVFWPENSISTFKTFIEPFLQQVEDLGDTQKSAILVGTVASNSEDQYFNSAFVYGLGSGHYYKHNLVPFGEYFPFAYFIEPFIAYFNIPMSSFNKGDEVQPLLKMNGLSVALFICYEIAYPSEVFSQLQNADLIVVISDDAWFGNSLAPWQHEEISQMRAIETGRYLIQATNNGITSIINPQGKVVASLPRNEQGVLKGKVYAMKGQTLWMTYGLLLSLIISLLSIFTSLIIFLYFKHSTGNNSRRL